jgi:hypothetical protein
MTAPILEQSQHPGVRGRAGDGRPRFYLLSFRVSTVSDRSWRAAPPSSSSSSTIAACVVACVVSKCLTSGLESRIFRSIDNFDGERQNEAAPPGRFKSQGHLSEPPPCLRGLRGATRLIDNDRPRSTKRQSETFAAHRRRAEQQQRKQQNSDTSPQSDAAGVDADAGCVRHYRQSHVPSWPPRCPDLLAGLFPSSPPLVCHLWTILGLICLVVQVVTSGENPGRCGRSSNRPDLATKRNPWTCCWLVGGGFSPRRVAGLIGGGLFQAAYPRSVSSRRYKTTPLRLSVNLSGRREGVVSFPSVAAGWAAGCIIYSLSLLF